ncbi:unnamed protein product [marine sediment metagenome]|uniref:DUF559 domain-containing protein n=1 Tax=marine sediment metagenome TaxID=412755 RepID=X1I0T9_9ZZZZ
MKDRDSEGRFRKGIVPHNKGKRFVHSGSFKKGHKINAGRKRFFTDEWKRNISLGHKGMHISPKTEFTKESRAKQIFPFKDTKIEVKIQNFLKQLGIEYFTHQYIKEIEHSYQCDILIPSMNLVIECDGNYWHKYPVGNDIDHVRTKELLQKGFKVLRLWEFEINDMDLSNFKNRLGRKICSGT